MSNKASGLKSAIDAFVQRRGTQAGMEQNLMKEAIHLQDYKSDPKISRWDVWFLVNKLGATPDREMVRKKFADYGTSDIATKAKARLDELTQDATATAFYNEMRRFLPSARIAQMSQMNLQRTMLSDSAELIRKSVV